MVADGRVAHPRKGRQLCCEWQSLVAGYGMPPRDRLHQVCVRVAQQLVCDRAGTLCGEVKAELTRLHLHLSTHACANVRAERRCPLLRADPHAVCNLYAIPHCWSQRDLLYIGCVGVFGSGSWRIIARHMTGSGMRVPAMHQNAPGKRSVTRIVMQLDLRASCCILCSRA